MDKKTARSIGRKRAFESVGIGMAVFYLVGVFIFSNEGLRSLLWMQYLDLYNWMFIANWIITFLVLAIIMGNYAGKEILLRKKSALIVGIKSAILALCLAAFFGCLLGFITEGLDNDGSSEFPLVDYLMIPAFWIVIYGVVPATLLGIFFGWRIKNSK